MIKHAKSNHHQQESQQPLEFRKQKSLLEKEILQEKENQDITVYFGAHNQNIIKNKHFPNNEISTTKYNFASLIPKSLLLQFKRAANIYFLIVSVLCFMDFSPKKPASQVGTFAFVLIATLLKEAVEDYARYTQDKASNNKLVEVLQNGVWEEIRCWKIMPGDIIKVKKNEELTCDILLTHCSNDNGYCYIDTKNLDGETNLKEKGCLEEFKSISLQELGTVEGEISCDYPNEKMTNWKGNLLFQGKEIYCDLKNLVLKGCVIKNTDHVYGIAVYTGKNTKIMKNSKQVVFKMSKVLKIMNKLLYSLFIFQIAICVMFAVLSLNWEDKHQHDYWYIFYNNINESSKTVSVIKNFLTYFVAYSQMIPISLYVALELVKIAQGILVNYDEEIFDFEINKAASCRTTDLIEELGQVEFIFSDKTGTLTQNMMILKKVYINGKIYGNLSDEQPNTKFTINGDKSASIKMKSTDEDDYDDSYMITEFFKLLSICHAVFPETTDNEIIYQGASPDDIALVKGAQQLGVEFVQKDFQDLHVTNHVLGCSYVHEMKVDIPFDSDRKRMSVLVYDKLEKKYYLYIKGADTMMLPRFDYSQDECLKEEIEKVIKSFSREGLRVLCMGKKEVNEAEFINWEARFNNLRNAGEDLSELYEELEKDIMFLGCSAIEDKLQDGVPEAIYTLLTCNIRIWVLTGDKQDTAEEIAKSCNLINENMFVMYLCEGDDEFYSVEVTLNFYSDEFGINTHQEEKQMNNLNNITNMNRVGEYDIDIEEITRKIHKKKGKDLSIIVDGKSLEVILKSDKLSFLFFKIAIAAKSVICCRVSPKQKAKVVALAKKYGNWITLSIGDGANDVPMIMEAHIGVGIQGKEGTQAVRSADYSIGQFRFLEKILLVYGRQGYMKISKFICYYFYKNILLLFTELFFSFYNGFSGQIYFADYLSTMYNAFFTSWPVLCTFIFEKDVDLNIVKKFPSLYKAGHDNYYFNLKIFWVYVLYAVFHGAYCFYIVDYGFRFLNGDDGLVLSHWAKSTISFSLIIHIATYKLMLISNFWNIISILSTILSLLFYYFILAMLCSKTFAYIFQHEVNGILDFIMSYPKVIVGLVLMPFSALIPDITFKILEHMATPNPMQYIVIFLRDLEFRNWIFKQEQQFLMLNSKEAKLADKEIKMILKQEKRRTRILNRDRIGPIKELTENDEN